MDENHLFSIICNISLYFSRAEDKSTLKFKIMNSHSVRDAIKRCLKRSFAYLHYNLGVIIIPYGTNTHIFRRNIKEHVDTKSSYFGPSVSYSLVKLGWGNIRHSFISRLRPEVVFLFDSIFLANRESDHVAKHSYRFCPRELWLEFYLTVGSETLQCI